MPTPSHRGYALSISLAFALACAAGVALPSGARASTGPGVIDLQGPDLAELPMIMLGTSAIAFGIVDLAYAVKQWPMPVALSIVQMAVAGLLMPTFALTSYGFRTLDRGEQVVIGVFGAVNMAWFTGHGFMQLRARRELSRRSNRELGSTR